MSVTQTRIGRTDCQQTGTRGPLDGTTPRFLGRLRVVSKLQRFSGVVPCLLQIASLTALLVGVAPPAAADEAALEKAASELIVLERRLAGGLDSTKREAVLREQERLERIARDLASEELRRPREESRRESEDRLDGTDMRVFDGRRVTRERGVRGGFENPRERRESGRRDGEGAPRGDPGKESDGDRDDDRDDDDRDDDDRDDLEDEEEDEEEEEQEEQEEEEEEEEEEEQEIDDDKSEFDIDIDD